MIGQGEGTDTMNPSKFLDDDGKNFLNDAAKEAGFPSIENWDEPTEKDIDTLYRLSFPEDNGDKETKINDIQVAFNEIRDENILDKSKELQKKGKIPIVVAGEGHVELVKIKSAMHKHIKLYEEYVNEAKSEIDELELGAVDHRFRPEDLELAVWYDKDAWTPAEVEKAAKGKDAEQLAALERVLKPKGFKPDPSGKHDYYPDELCIVWKLKKR